MKHKRLIASLKKHAAVIAKERDALRDMESEIRDLADSCDEALTSLENAVDRLSELV